MNYNELILNHLRSGETLTHKDAERLFGCARLGARICELRQMGHEIMTTMEDGKNVLGHPTRYARYSMRRAAE